MALYVSEQAHDLAKDAKVGAPWIHDDGLHGRMLRLEHAHAALGGETLARRLLIHEGRHDVARGGAVLLAHEDEVPVGDMRLDHAVALYAQSEDFTALGREPLRS